MFVIIYLVLCSMIGETLLSRTLHEYNVERRSILEEEIEMQVGGRLRLTDDERSANEILMRWKHLEVQESFDNPRHFNFSRHYFTYKHQIKESKVYQIIRRMPKGAALHVHSSLMLSVDRVMELTYEDHLYACIGDDYLDLQFSITSPQRPCPYKWHLLNELRNASNDIAIFDSELRKHFTMYTDDTNDMNRDINYTWKRFNKICHALKALISYRPVREKYFYEGLKEFYNDNVRYIEVRSGLSKLYELDGTVHDPMYMPRLIDRVTRNFKEKHPDFIGVKLIVTHRRYRNMTQMQAVIDATRQIKEELPDVYAGLDLVGQEDLGKPLLDFVPLLLEAQSDVNFYFHGGETNWFGTSTDENLVDAILLGSKRIGHGYALIKHPALMAAVQRNDIAIEVNVVSNTVLSLVSDVRNHPLATYLALGMPVVISSDDPGAWGADPLSHDFYIAFVGVASKKADLRMLKQLVINSIRYSALEDRGKTSLFRLFNKNWQEFIKYVITTDSLK